jgi:hypothetical protein
MAHEFVTNQNTDESKDPQVVETRNSLRELGLDPLMRPGSPRAFTGIQRGVVDLRRIVQYPRSQGGLRGPLGNRDSGQVYRQFRWFRDISNHFNPKSFQAEATNESLSTSKRIRSIGVGLSQY